MSSSCENVLLQWKRDFLLLFNLLKNIPLRFGELNICLGCHASFELLYIHVV